MTNIGRLDFEKTRNEWGQQILEKAIRKAAQNGWKPNLPQPRSQNIVEPEHIPLVIFDKNFAKALWGKEEIKRCYCDCCDYVDPIENWKLHLQSMVIADDPIKYLGENI